MTTPPAFDVVFRQLFDAQFPALYRYLDRLSGDSALAQDLAQEAFVRLYQRGALPDDVRGWLGTVATNLFRDEVRRTGRRRHLLSVQPPELTLGSQAPPADDMVIADERKTAVRAALEHLPLRDRQLLLLRHEGYSYRELAVAVGIAEGSVGTLLVRATAAFRRAFLGSQRASE